MHHTEEDRRLWLQRECCSESLEPLKRKRFEFTSFITLIRLWLGGGGRVHERNMIDLQSRVGDDRHEMWKFLLSTWLDLSNQTAAIVCFFYFASDIFKKRNNFLSCTSPLVVSSSPGAVVFIYKKSCCMQNSRRNIKKREAFEFHQTLHITCNLCVKVKGKIKHAWIAR